jgi:hypothetical protein
VSGTVPPPPGWKDDWLAILAFAAYTDRPDPAEAFAAWHNLSDRKRASWRAVAGSVEAAVRHRDALEVL